MNSMRLTEKNRSDLRRTDDIFKIKETERVLIAGTTGSGKSELEKALLTNRHNVVVHDPKAEFELDKARYVTNPHNLGDLRVGDPRPIIYQPEPHYNNYETNDMFFRWVYYRKNTTLAIDELTAAFRLGAPNTWLTACIVQGRSRHISMFALTQRPSKIPIEILSESTHRFMFEMEWMDDVKRMSGLMKMDYKELLKGLPGPYDFWYRNRSDKELPAMPYVLDLGGNSARKSDRI